jgi:putative DNA primase/helicase
MNFDTIKAAALASIESVLSRWAPGGKRQGREYLPLNPRRSDSKPGSFSINLDTGAWSDFATGDKGGDLVALVAYLGSVKQSEAAAQLAEFLGLILDKAGLSKRATGRQSEAANTQAPAQPKGASWRALLPVPTDAPQPPKTHTKHGLFSMRWEYRNDEGGLLCLVYRFEAKAEGERKQFCPLTFCEDAKGKREWRWQGLLDPRPLYRLDKLAAAPDAPIVVCEGEKAADAAALLFPDAVATTMLNGAQSPHKTDWRPLKGRMVLLWPDNDAAGSACMMSVAGLLEKAGATKVQQINLAVFARVPGVDGEGKPMLSDGAAPPDKWDAADAVKDGWTAGHINLLRAMPDWLQPPSDKAATKPQTPAAQVTTATPESQFLSNDQGVWYFGKNDTGTEAPALWICSKLEITALTRDAKNEAWGRLIEFDDLDGTHHAWALPMEMLKGDGAEYRGVLLSMGLQMSTMAKARNLLTQYIQTAPVHTRARCVDRTGWHDSVFVMPERTLGEAEERILYQSASAAPGTFKQRGKLADWQKHVSAPCAGNSRLVFAVCTAFAAPLLHITGMESGGIHYRGDSSTGKTTALRVAASVWGGAEYLQRWRATDNGLEALAAQHSDCLLVLDELSQVDPKAAGEVAYMLANGSGKARASRTGTLRDTASWRLLFLSSGEAGLAEHMALAGRKPKAGMEIRLLDIPADAGHGLGLFDTLHDHASGAAFSKEITEAALKYHGTPALAFLENVIKHLDELPGLVKKAQLGFNTRNLADDAAGQAHRAALRFALVGAAGEIATAWKITGWQSGAAMLAAETCFKAWLAQRGGGGNQEAAAMLSQVRQFFELHGDARFVDWERAGDDHAPKTVNRAGFRKTRDAVSETGAAVFDDSDNRARETEFFVLPEVFRQEICKSFDYKTVARLLVEQGYMVTDGRNLSSNARLPGIGLTRCYRITQKLLGGNNE